MHETAITLVEAINQALAYELNNDPSVVLMGEDVGINGGVFRATVGLKKKISNPRARHSFSRRYVSRTCCRHVYPIIKTYY